MQTKPKTQTNRGPTQKDDDCATCGENHKMAIVESCSVIWERNDPKPHPREPFCLLPNPNIRVRLAAQLLGLAGASLRGQTCHPPAPLLLLRPHPLGLHHLRHHRHHLRHHRCRHHRPHHCHRLHLQLSASRLFLGRWMQAAASCHHAFFFFLQKTDGGRKCRKTEIELGCLAVRRITETHKDE